MMMMMTMNLLKKRMKEMKWMMCLVT